VLWAGCARLRVAVTRPLLRAASGRGGWVGVAAMPSKIHAAYGTLRFVPLSMADARQRVANSSSDGDRQ